MFCVLEKDAKTFEYFRRYVGCFESGEACMDLDNHIQAEELARHLEVHGFHPGDTQAKLDWVTINAAPFREYLNTIKLVYVVLKSQGMDVHGVTKDEFLKVEERLNQMRHCLTSIF